jgi:hypothetical protein
MERRDALHQMSLMLGGIVLSPSLTKFVNGYMPQAKPAHLSIFGGAAEAIALITELADTIIPTTTTPGAKEAGSAKTIALVVDDCYNPKEQQRFMEGLAAIEALSKDINQKGFVQSTPEERIAVLKKFAAQAAISKKAGKKDNFWFEIKGLAVATYFRSEIGATQALEYDAVPGKFDGNTELKKGQKAWATN